MTTRGSHRLLFGGLALALAASAFAQSVPRTRRAPIAKPRKAAGRPVAEVGTPGSVLVFPKFEAGQVVTPDQGPLPRTQFEVSVVCPKGTAGTDVCVAGRAVRLKGRWVCAGDADRYCKASEFDLVTTVNGTVVFDPDDVLLGKRFPGAQGVTPPACDQAPGSDVESGYVMVWVVDGSGSPIKFDGLIGDGVHRGNAVVARAFNGFPIQAAERLATNDRIALSPDGSLPFDGKGYRAVTGKIYGSVRYDDAEKGLRTSLALLTLNVKPNAVNDATSLDLRFSNEDQEVKSGSARFICWGQAALSGFGVGLDRGFGAKGLVESTRVVQADRSAMVMGIVESDEVFSGVVDVPAHVSWHLSGAGQQGGSTLHCGMPSGGSCQASCTFSPTCLGRRDRYGNCPWSGLAMQYNCTLVTDSVAQTLLPQERGYMYLFFSDDPVPASFSPLPEATLPPD